MKDRLSPRPIRQEAAAALCATGLVILLVSLAIGCSRTAPPTPLDQLNPQQKAGHAVYQARCAVCHSDRDDRARVGPALVGIFKKPYLHSGAPANDERVTATVEHGHGLMPAMGAQVQGDDLTDLLAYLHTL